MKKIEIWIEGDSEEQSCIDIMQSVHLIVKGTSFENIVLKVNTLPNDPPIREIKIPSFLQLANVKGKIDQESEYVRRRKYGITST